jgi:hypothetical protein
MTPGIAMASAAAAAALSAAILVAADGNGSRATTEPAVADRSASVRARLVAPTQHRPPRVGCGRRSMADFPGAFSSPRNLVVGPFVLVGAGEPTPASVVREFGGNKFPALLKAGHVVTLRVPREARRFAGLAYGGLGDGPLPQGEISFGDTAHTMTFAACQPGTRSGSHAGAEEVTFWSGFVVLRKPACVPLEIQVDDEPRPRRAMLDMGGRRCGV